MSRATNVPRIAVISAVPAAVGPAEAALHAALPGAEVWNILDDRLLSDARAVGGVDETLRGRMTGLVDYAFAGGADAVLVTCSLYGATVAALAAADGRPAVPADDAAFAEVAERGFSRIAVVAPLPEALADSVSRLRAQLPADGAPEIVGVVAEGAHAASLESPEALAAVILAALDDARGIDAVLLAQYSLAPAAPLVAARIGLPVLTTPDSAARAVAHLTRTGDAA